MPEPIRLFYQSPPDIVRNARLTAWLMMVFYGIFLGPIFCAGLGVLAALVIGPVGGIVIAILLWPTCYIAMWCLLRRRTFFELVLEHSQLRIGQGRRAATWHPADVDLIIASPNMSPGTLKLLHALHLGLLVAAQPTAKPSPGFVRVQGQGRTRWIFLPVDQVESFAAQLAYACPNAVYVDIHEVEHEPPSGIPATAALILLSRQTRDLALGIGIFALTTGFCTVCSVLSRLYDPPNNRAPTIAVELCLSAFLGCTGATWAFFRKRARYLQQIRDRQPNPYHQARPLSPLS